MSGQKRRKPDSALQEAQSKQPKRHALELSTLIQRQCRCCFKDCYTQFRKRCEEVEAVRKEFQELDPERKVAFLQSQYGYGHGFTPNECSTECPPLMLDSDDELDAHGDDTEKHDDEEILYDSDDDKDAQSDDNVEEALVIKRLKWPLKPEPF